MGGIAIGLTDASGVGEARRVAALLARQLGFDEDDRGRLAIIITELARNAVQHAGEGQLFLSAVERRAVAVEALCVDRGPGMGDIDQCMQDGFSTGGTRGAGLGAIARLADTFDVWSHAGRGTAVLARVHKRASAGVPVEERDGLRVGAVCVPRPGEEACGDDWALWEREGRALLLVVDGLGHGPQAARAARMAVDTFLEMAPHRSPAHILEAAHDALRSTRGAALAVAELDTAVQRVRLASVGNIAGAIVVEDRAHRLIAQNGTVGHTVPRVQELPYSWPAEATLVLHSDGLATHWTAAAYAGLWRRDPALVAAVLYRDLVRGRDDATCACARWSPG